LDTDPFPISSVKLCHLLEQCCDEQSGRCSLLTPALLTTTGRKKGGKGGETYKLNIKTALLTTLIMLIIVIIKEIRQTSQN